jgi:hypothetical protein
MTLITGQDLGSQIEELARSFHWACRDCDQHTVNPGQTWDRARRHVAQTGHTVTGSGMTTFLITPERNPA